MAWKVELTEAAEEDFSRLDGSLRKLVRKKLAKLEENPYIGVAGRTGEDDEA